MQRKFLNNLAILLLLNVLIKPFYIFGIDRTVQNLVGPESYGFYFTIFNFAFLFNILLDAGITNFNNRNIAQNQQLLNKHFSRLLVLRLLLALFYAVVTFLTAWVIGYKEHQMKILIWIAVNNFLLSFILYLRSNISGLLMFMTDSFLSVLDRIIMIAICAFLIWGPYLGGEFRIEWFIYAQTASYVITFLIAFIIVIRKASFTRLTWSWPFFMMILKYSFPFALLYLLMSFYARTDSVFIERLISGEEGNRQVGIFAMGYRILDATNQFAMLFGMLLFPIYSRLIKQKRPIVEMILLPSKLLLSGALILAVASWFYRFEIMELLYPMQVHETLTEHIYKINEAAKIYGLLMFGLLGTCLMTIFSSLLSANDNLRQLNVIATIAIGVNFALNLSLIPVMKAAGAAWANLGTQVFTGLAFVVVVQYMFRFRISYRLLISSVIYIILVVLAGWLSTYFSQSWILNISTMLVFSFLVAILLKLLDLKAFIAILKQREVE